MFEILDASEHRTSLATRPTPSRMGSWCPGHVSTPTHPSSHPRGFRLFTCQRAKLPTFVTYFSHTPDLPRRFVAVLLFPRPRASLRFYPFGFAFPAEGAESYRAFRRCQSAAGKILVEPFSTSKRHQNRPNDLTGRRTHSSNCQRCCKSNLRPGLLKVPQFKHRDGSGIEW